MRVRLVQQRLAVGRLRQICLQENRIRAERRGGHGAALRFPPVHDHPHAFGRQGPRARTHLASPAMAAAAAVTGRITDVRKLGGQGA